MKVTVIGANSYIARNLIYFLNKEKAELFLYDRQSQHFDGYDSYMQVNILDREELRKIRFDVDSIYMFIGKTGSIDGFSNFDLYIDVNERALLYVLQEYVAQKATAKVIFPSTRLVYKGSSKPLKEESKKEFKTIYAINKFACEQYLSMFHNVYGVKYVIFRICVPYGTMIPEASSYGTTEFFLSKALKGEDITIYGSGSQRRSLTYIGDVCKTLIRGAENELTNNQIYNIGGENYSLFEMASLIAQKYHVKISHIEWPEVPFLIESGDTVFDSSKLDSLILLNRELTFKEWLNKN